jgi:hypothetical protein
VLVAAPEDHVGGFEENDDPVGAPVWLSVTGAAKPFWAVKETARLVAVPAVTVFVAGERPSVKVGAALMVTVDVAEAVTPVPVPVTLMEYVPTGALEGMVSVLEAAPEDQVGGFEAKLAPVGAPVWVSVTGAAKPLCAVRATARLVAVPAVTVFVAGDRASVKVGATSTTRVEVADSMIPVPVPVTLMV